MSEVKSNTRGKKLTIKQVEEIFSSKNCILLSKEYKRMTDTLFYVCVCGEYAEKSLKNFQSHPYCKKCVSKNKSKGIKGRSKYNYKTVSDYFKEHGCVLLTTEYRSVSQKLDYLCHCGRKAEISFSKFKSGRRCMKCADDARAKARRHPYKKVKNDFDDAGYKLLTSEEDYIDASSSVNFICDKGHLRETTYVSFRKGVRCTGCTGREKHTYEYVREIFEKAGCILLDDAYVNNETKLNYVCTCGNQSSIKFQNFIMGKRCYECRSEKISESSKLPYEYVKMFFEDNGCTLISTEYKNLPSSLRYICKCGRESISSFATFKDSKKCKKCSFENLKNPDITDEDRVNQRKIDGYSNWRTEVYERDSYTCQCCGDNWSGRLNAHHKDGYHWCKERRIDVSNGVTLCEECHRLGDYSFHALYGNTNNTENQYDEWLLKYRNYNVKERRIS